MTFNGYSLYFIVSFLFNIMDFESMKGLNLKDPFMV